MTGVTGVRAVLDACVLYPTVLREITLGLCDAGLITPIWSERLLEEWARTAERLGGAVDATLARGEIVRLKSAYPDALVPRDLKREAGLWLPDGGDVHVLATAITGEAEVIATLNLKDFPRSELSPHRVEARHPDALFYDLWLEAPDVVAAVVARVQGQAETLSGEGMPLRALLKRIRLPRLAKALTR